MLIKNIFLLLFYTIKSSILNYRSKVIVVEIIKLVRNRYLNIYGDFINHTDINNEQKDFCYSFVQPCICLTPHLYKYALHL